MRTQFAVAVCSALIGALVWSAPASAQQKTVKACRDEWQAAKADYQAKGITEKAYVAQCRAGGAPAAQPTAAPETTPTPSPAAVTTPPVPAMARMMPVFSPAPISSLNLEMSSRL